MLRKFLILAIVVVGVLGAMAAILLALLVRTQAADYQVLSVQIDDQQFRFVPSKDFNAMIGTLTKTEGLKPTLLEKPEAPPVAWKQQQFIDLIEYIAADEIKLGAKVSEVYFGVSCRNVESGPQSLTMVFYHLGTYQDQPARIETKVKVDAQAGIIMRSTNIYYPADSSFVDDVNLDQSISAEASLALAEQRNGKEIRESNKNDCLAQGDLLDNKWSIRYRTLGGQGQEFLNAFNALTGEALPR